MQRMQWVVKKKDPGNANEKREFWADSSPIVNAEAGAEAAPAGVGTAPVRGKRSRGKFLKEDVKPAADEAEWEEEQWDWSYYVTVRDISVTSELGRQGMRDKDLPGFLVYLEETLEKVQQSKSSYKHQLDLSDNKDITDKGVVDHLVPFLERWPECHRLKLYKTSCGEEAIKSLAPWVSMGYARELHLSDMGGQVSGESVLTLLRQVHRGGKYPYWLNDKASCALWLRLEHNGIPSKEVVRKANKEGLSIRVLEKEEIRTVRPGVPSRNWEYAMHLVIFHVQDLRVKRQVPADRPKVDAEDSCAAAPATGSGSADAFVPATSSSSKGASKDAAPAATPAVASRSPGEKAQKSWTEKVVPQDATAAPADSCADERPPGATSGKAGDGKEGAPRAPEDAEASASGAPVAEAGGETADQEQAGGRRQPLKDGDEILRFLRSCLPDGEPALLESWREHLSDCDNPDEKARKAEAMMARLREQGYHGAGAASVEATPAAAGGKAGSSAEPPIQWQRLRSSKEEGRASRQQKPPPSNLSKETLARGPRAQPASPPIGTGRPVGPARPAATDVQAAAPSPSVQEVATDAGPGEKVKKGKNKITAAPR